jgi:hypothetical protein
VRMPGWEVSQRQHCLVRDEWQSSKARMPTPS